jgi:hypothetical protein
MTTLLKGSKAKAIDQGEHFEYLIDWKCGVWQ